MSSESGPLPTLRIGDAERDTAAELLREHLAVGRLDLAEFDERVGRALEARTVADLEPLFQDLPGPRPTLAAPAGRAGLRFEPPTSRSLPGRPVRRGNRAFPVVAAVAWPLIIMVCFVVGWRLWWLIFIPIILNSAVGPRHGHRHSHGHRWR